MGQYRIPTAREAARARRTGAHRAAAPFAASAHYDSVRGRIVLEFDRDCALAFEPTIYPYLAQASPSELEEIELLGSGTAINFPRINVSLSLGNLIADLLTPPKRNEVSS